MRAAGNATFPGAVVKVGTLVARSVEGDAGGSFERAIWRFISRSFRAGSLLRWVMPRAFR